MPDGNHCSRPHPAIVHDQMIKFERIARVNQGPDPGRIWDPDSDLYYGELELDESKRVAGAGRPIMMHQVNADACLDYFFSREERLNQLVSSPTTRAELWDLYIARKSCNNGWHIPFLGVKADEKGRFDAKKELLRWINTTGPRVYLGGEITTFPDGFKNHNPAEGMRPGGWSPLNEADYYNAYELQKQEKVCSDHLHHISFTFPSSQHQHKVRMAKIKETGANLSARGQMLMSLKDRTLPKHPKNRPSILSTCSNDGFDDDMDTEDNQHPLELVSFSFRHSHASNTPIQTSGNWVDLMKSLQHVLVKDKTGRNVFVPTDVVEEERWRWASNVSMTQYGEASDDGTTILLVPKYVLQMQTEIQLRGAEQVRLLTRVAFTAFHFLSAGPLQQLGWQDGCFHYVQRHLQDSGRSS